MRLKGIPVTITILLFLCACNKSQESKLKAPEILLQEQTTPESHVQEINSLAMAPREILGDSRESIKMKLGPWISLETKQAENRHDPEQMDNYYILNYNGLIIIIIEASAREMLLDIAMTQNYPGILPELIGLNRETIELRFGPANQPEGKYLKYTAVDDGYSQDTVGFIFEQDVVVSVEWSYYID
jgi:hypothetical protein